MEAIATCVKKSLHLIVIVDGLKLGGSALTDAAGLFAKMGLKPESYLANVFYCGTSLELHFGNIYRREEFLRLFTVCLETGRIKGLALRCHPSSRVEGRWPFNRVGDLRDASVLKREERVADVKKEEKQTAEEHIVELRPRKRGKKEENDVTVKKTKHDTDTETQEGKEEKNEETARRDVRDDDGFLKVLSEYLERFKRRT